MLNCIKCGHQWFPRSNKKPALCPNPKCHTAYWEIAKRQPEPKPAKVYINERYNFETIAVGETRAYKFYTDPKTNQPDWNKNRKFGNAWTMYNRRARAIGRRYFAEGKGYTFYIKRLPDAETTPEPEVI